MDSASSRDDEFSEDYREPLVVGGNSTPAETSFIVKLLAKHSKDRATMQVFAEELLDGMGGAHGLAKQVKVCLNAEGVSKAVRAQLLKTVLSILEQYLPKKVDNILDSVSEEEMAGVLAEIGKSIRGPARNGHS